MKKSLFFILFISFLNADVPQASKVQTMPIVYERATVNEPQEHQPPQLYSTSNPVQDTMQVNEQDYRQHSHEQSLPEPRPESTDQPNSERIRTIGTQSSSTIR